MILSPSLFIYVPDRSASHAAPGLQSGRVDAAGGLSAA